MRGLACIGLGDFAAPPGELGRGDAGVADFVHDIIDLAAERIERGDGRAPLLGQEKKSVIKAAARGGSFFLDVLGRIHIGADSPMITVGSLRCWPFDPSASSGSGRTVCVRLS
ncbi:hypothetical protein D3C86_1780790 [compost metagenome]